MKRFILFVILSLTLSQILKSNIAYGLNVRSLPIAGQTANNAEPNPLIEKACASAKNVGSCTETLSLGKGSQVADMKTLGFISLNVTKKLANEIYETIEKYLDKEEQLGPAMDDAFVECEDQYDDANTQIDNALIAFFANNVKDVNTFVNVAIKNADTCQQALKKANVEAKLGDKNTVFAEECANALVVVNALGKH